LAIRDKDDVIFLKNLFGGMERDRAVSPRKKYWAAIVNIFRSDTKRDADEQKENNAECFHRGFRATGLSGADRGFREA